MILNRGIDSDDYGGDRGPRTNPRDPAQDRPPPLELPFTIGDLARLRHQVTRRAENAGLCDPRLGDFVLAVHEVASNAIVHGGGKGHIHLDHTDDGLRCVITDNGPGLARPLNGHSHGHGIDIDIDSSVDDEAENGRGLWLAEALADRLDITVGDTGTTVTLVALLP
ncbi:ATP-binding protein [Streptomyces sp. NBC_01381]|uniref:ATP-binding protein n=1 Tax=Streptomyces sp. NBC_01381 TaxID=2903845 RepID=UPI00224E77EE|nr:ATP-binding protein [Streptomyces sp. NBC_01381]MCX4670601.1 ATP-binding protein [Streptomyces sp. NBC_01381]